MNKLRAVLAFFRGNRIFKFAVLLSACSVFGILFLGIIISMMSSAIRDAKHREAFIHDDMASQRYTRLVRALNEMEQHKDILRELVVQDNDLTSFIRRLESIAISTDTALVIETVPLSDAKDQIQYSVPTIRYRLKISGSRSNITSYLSTLHAVSPLVHIERVSLSSQDENQTIEQAKAEVIIVVAVEGDV